MREGRDITPYGQKIEDNIIRELMARAGADQRIPHAAATKSRAFNQQSRFLKKGLALTPVKFGISFTLTHLNQAGALVHVYTDGSVHLNHGGTEMGQGLYVKVAQVVAEEFGIGLDRVKITATTTGKVPNTSPTAASSGSDLNGMAAQHAAETIRGRLVEFAAAALQGAPRSRSASKAARSSSATNALPFADLVKRAYLARVSLSSTGFYATPKHRLGPGEGEGPPVLLFRLWRGLRRSDHRHAHRRDAGRPRGHPARCRAAR